MEGHHLCFLLLRTVASSSGIAFETTRNSTDFVASDGEYSEHEQQQQKMTTEKSGRFHVEDGSCMDSSLPLFLLWKGWFHVPGYSDSTKLLWIGNWFIDVL